MRHLFKTLALLFLLSAAKNLVAQDSVYTFYKSISIPGNGNYDYISIDEVNRHLFVTHGTVLDIVDLNTENSY